MFMLDTNVLMHVVNKAPGYRNIIKQLAKHSTADIVLSAITAHELHYKIHKQRIGKARIDNLDILMQRHKVIPFNNKAAEVAAKVRVHLEGCGTKISYWDTLIASHAKALELVCVTDNVGEYDRVPGISGSADGIGQAARFFGPQGLAIDTTGNLWVADSNNSMIRKIVVSSGAVTTVAGHPGGYGSLDGPSSSAEFRGPSSIAMDHDGFLYVVDTETNEVRAITTHGGVSTPAGRYTSGSSADGVGEAVRFNHPTGIAVDFADNLYIADADNHTIRLAYFTAAPAITAQPLSQTLTTGASAQFSVSVTGKPALAFQWYLNGTVLSGATSRSLLLRNVQPANAGSYTVAVTNDSGSVTSNPATLTVNTISPESTGGNTGGAGANGGGGAMDCWFAGLLILLCAARRAIPNRIV